MDAATGETVKVYEGTEGTEEVICQTGILLLAVRSVTRQQVDELAKWAELLRRKESPLDDRDSAEPLVRGLRAAEASGEKAVVALEAETGRVLWKKEGADAAGLRTLSLCADGDRVFYQNAKDLVCLDLKTGREVWSASSLENGHLVCMDDQSASEG